MIIFSIIYLTIGVAYAILCYGLGVIRDLWERYEISSNISKAILVIWATILWVTIWPVALFIGFLEWRIKR